MNGRQDITGQLNVAGAYGSNANRAVSSQIPQKGMTDKECAQYDALTDLWIWSAARAR